MKRRLFLVTLLACAASAEGQQQEQHVIASPNPTVDESTTSSVEHGKVTATKVQPAASQTAAPMKKKATRPKRKRKSRQ